MRVRLILICLLAAFSAAPGTAQETRGDETARLLELRQSARGGDVDAMYELASVYERGADGTRADLSEAASWFARAATAGHTLAQRTLALMHLEGRGVPQSFEEAQQLFFQAAQKNDEISQYHLGILLLTGRGGQMSVETAVQWLERAAEAGHAGAQVELGRAYLEGAHVDKDEQRGLSWIRQAASQGHTPAVYLLAVFFEAGEIIPEDPAQAQQLFNQAAEAGLADAQVWVGQWHEKQSPPDYPRALRYYRDAARQGNADGHFGVARLNLERLLRTSNSQEGLRHLREAVSLNHAEAHYTIGRMYGSGSLSGGSALALQHFQQAANRGYTPAMYELAVAYYQGTAPVKKNAVLAAQWWRRASQAGHLESQYAFALLHLSGSGVEKNSGVAFALANVAAAQGHAEAAKVRDELMTSMPPETLRQAQDLSVQLFAQYALNADANMKAQLK